jgi:hypothetical protein
MARDIIIPSRAVPAVSLGAMALGAFALGAAAVGVFAIGRLAIGQLDIRKARFGVLEVDHLTVRRLCVLETEDRKG